MTDWTSISVTEEQKAALEAAQEQAGHDGAIGRFLVQEVTGEDTPDMDERLSDILSAATTAEERTGRIEQQLEALQEARV